MNFIITAFLCAFMFYIATTQFLFHPLKQTGKYVLFIYILIIYLYFGSLFDRFIPQSTTIALILGCELIIAIYSDQKILNITFSLITYNWSVFLNHLLTIPLSYIGISISAIAQYYNIIFLCTFIALLLIGSFIIKRFFHRFFDRDSFCFPLQLQIPLLTETVLSTCCIAFNIIYGAVFNYPTAVLTYNGILFGLFSSVTTAILFFAIKIMQKDQQLAIKQKEQEALNNYMNKMENLCQEMRTFRHDYINILSTLNCYIEDGDLPELKTYFHNKILPTGQILTDNDILIGKLSNIKITALKGILYSKLICAMNLSLNISLEIRDPILTLSMDMLDLSRILGILLDNALEAASVTTEKKLDIAIIHLPGTISICIDNSTPPLSFPFSQIGVKGMTSKPGHSGIGLYQTTDMIENYSNVFLSTTLHDHTFSQKLDILDTDKQEDTL